MTTEPTPQVTATEDVKIIVHRMVKAEPPPPIPANASAHDLWKVLSAYGYLDKQLYRWRINIGRILIRFQENPELYQELGYSDFTDFMERGVEQTLGIRRSVRYEAMDLARRWGDTLTPDDFVAIGPKKIRILKAFDDGGPKRQKLIEAAKTMTVAEFQQLAHEKFAVQPRSAVPVTIQIHTTKEISDRWREFVFSDRVSDYVGSSDHGRILEAMIICFEQEMENHATDRRS